jgi:plastocyanin
MKRLVSVLGLLGAALLLGACSAGAPSAAPVSADSDALRISSKDLKFSTALLEAPAEEAFQIVYENQEAAPHNVAIYKTEAATEKILVEAPFSGPKTVVYTVPAQPAGSYFFRCDVHPDMKGTLEVE